MSARIFSSLGKCFKSVHVHSRSLNNEIGVIGVPFAKGQTKPGVATAPQHLRDAGMIRKLEAMGYGVTDFGDLQFEALPHDNPSHNIKFPRTIARATQKISNNVTNILRSGKTCLTLGGDHSLSIGTIHGHAQVEPDMTLVWVDAHADINPPLASMSGNIHGMVLAFLIKELADYVPRIPGFEWVTPPLAAKDIAFIGLRDIDPAERFIIESMGITCYTMHDVDRHGIDYVLEKAIDTVNPGMKRPMHLSYDIDALDPAVSPSTGTPVPGGLTIREGMYIAEELAATDQLTCIDLVEVNPELGTRKDQDLTLFTAVEVIAACFGKRRRGNVPEGYELPRPASLVDVHS